MPNIKSAIKRVRTSERNRQRNRSVKAALQSKRRTLLKALEDGTTAESEFRGYASLLDKAVKKGVVPRNTADRRKQRMAKRLNVAGKSD